MMVAASKAKALLPADYGSTPEYAGMTHVQALVTYGMLTDQEAFAYEYIRDLFYSTVTWGKQDANSWDFALQCWEALVGEEFDGEIETLGELWQQLLAHERTTPPPTGVDTEMEDDYAGRWSNQT